MWQTHDLIIMYDAERVMLLELMWTWVVLKSSLWREEWELLCSHSLRRLERLVRSLSLSFSITHSHTHTLPLPPPPSLQILTTLVKGVSKPVTCKIRILPTVCPHTSTHSHIYIHYYMHTAWGDSEVSSIDWEYWSSCYRNTWQVIIYILYIIYYSRESLYSLSGTTEPGNTQWHIWIEDTSYMYSFCMVKVVLSV